MLKKRELDSSSKSQHREKSYIILWKVLFIIEEDILLNIKYMLKSTSDHKKELQSNFYYLVGIFA